MKNETSNIDISNSNDITKNKKGNNLSNQIIENIYNIKDNFINLFTMLFLHLFEPLE